MGRGRRIKWKKDWGEEKRRTKNLEGRKQKSQSMKRYLNSRCETTLSEYWAVERQIIHGVFPGFHVCWLHQWGDATHNKQVCQRKWTWKLFTYEEFIHVLGIWNMIEVAELLKCKCIGRHLWAMFWQGNAYSSFWGVPKHVATIEFWWHGSASPWLHPRCEC